MDALLISNSTQFGRGYLHHAEEHIRRLLGDRKRVAFVPYAEFDLDAYESKAARRFAEMGCQLTSVHRGTRLGDTDAVFVGGGNTFRLLHRLRQTGLLAEIGSRVRDGMPYLGSSAGAIVAGPTLKTTKDMPVVEPGSFDALGLVPFHISPHYLDPDPSSRHMGETQEERILQFLQENDGRVVGLREGSMLLVHDGRTTVLGDLPVRLFERGRPPVECPPGPLQWLR